MSTESSSTSYVLTIAAILSVPLLACVVLMLADPGILPSLLRSSLTHGVAIVAVAAALSYGAHYLSTRRSDS